MKENKTVTKVLDILSDLEWKCEDAENELNSSINTPEYKLLKKTLPKNRYLAMCAAYDKVLNTLYELNYECQLCNEILDQ